MQLSTHNLVLQATSRIDMQLHTINSDGTWTPEGLLDYLKAEHFSMVAITDHDRVDQTATLQQLAMAKGLPVLVAAEMSTHWRGHHVDVLCFGFDPESAALRQLTKDVLDMQQANTRQVYEYLLRHGYTFDRESDPLQTILDQPASRHPHALAALLSTSEKALDLAAVWMVLETGGVKFATNPIGAVVNAVQASGGVCLIAHPGRGDHYPVFDPQLLDDLRSDTPIDGFEAYYPVHSAEQTAMFADYARRHNLLVSAGSDSHGIQKKPIPYPAHLSSKLLERLGVRVLDQP